MYVKSAILSDFTVAGMQPSARKGALWHLCTNSILYILGILWIKMEQHATEASQPPRNLTVQRVSGSGATFAWLVDRTAAEDVLFYELTYELRDSREGSFRVVRGIRRDLKQIEVGCLRPTSVYSAYMVTVDTEEIRSNVSNEVVFTTTSDDVEAIRPAAYTPHFGEIVIVAFVIIAWMVAVMLFLKRWASIRILQPMEPRYRHSPKNLENVKIVKRPQDSVIYKNYGRKLSITIVEREKRRLQRMHTIATLPTIEMERVVTEM